MNVAQELWWRQARSDWDLLLLLRRTGAANCHLLHYLQMSTEKIAKAYMLRSTKMKKSHAGLGKFLRFVSQSSGGDSLQKLAGLFSFKRVDDFDAWIRSIRPLADDLEHLAPALANDGPNPEYPWPHANALDTPVLYDFPIWKNLNTIQGRKLIHFIETAVTCFPEYADLS